jgi:hypothetical protein
MRRAEIIEGASQIYEAIEGNELREVFFESLRTQATPQTHERLLSVYRNYSLVAQNFTSASKEMLQILELEFLEEASFWAAMMNAGGTDAAPLRIRKTLSTMASAVEFLPQLSRLIESDSSKIRASITSNGSSEHAVISILLVEPDEQPSSPLKLITLLNSVQLLYESCAMILDEPSQDLSVIACDSGNDKSFDFLGNAEVIKSLKEIVYSTRDRLTFQDNGQENVLEDSFVKSLPIMTRIQHLEESGALTSEKAKRLQNKLGDGLNEFASSGGMLLELEQSTIQISPAAEKPEAQMSTEPANESIVQSSGGYKERTGALPQTKQFDSQLLKKVEELEKQ